MQNRFFCAIAMLLAITISVAQTKESKELYAQGVELYRNGQYEESIPFFLKVDTLDNSSLLQYPHDNDWLASAYYKIGDEKHAQYYSPSFSYEMPPVDRRMTERSDSIGRLVDKCYQSKDYAMAYEYTIQAYETLLEELGCESYYSLVHYENLAYLNYLLGKEEEAVKLIKDMFAKCSVAFGKCCLHQYAQMSLFSRFVGSLGNTELMEQLSSDLLDKMTDNNVINYDLITTHIGYCADVYIQLGKIEESQVHIKKLLEMKVAQYGKNSKEYIEQLVHIADIYTKIKDYDLAISYADDAETLIRGNNELGDLIYMVYATKVNIYMSQGKIRDAEKFRRLIQNPNMVTDVDYFYLNEYKSIVKIISQIQQTGKVNKKDLRKAITLCEELEKHVASTDFSLLKMNLALYLSLANDTQSLDWVDNQMDVLLESPLCEPLFIACLVYLQNGYFVKARIASSAAMQRLQSSMEKNMNYAVAMQSESHIDGGLKILDKYVNKLTLEEDTTSYSKSMICQDLLYSKLLIMEQRDSMNTHAFMNCLKKMLFITENETCDIVMRDSAYSRYSAKILARYGENSDSYKQFLEMNQQLQFEKDNPTVHRLLEWYSPGSNGFVSMEHYKKQLAEYNNAYEEWKEMKRAGVADEHKIDNKPKFPSILDVRRDKNFAEAMAQYDTFIEFQYTEHYGNDILSAMVCWCECADSLGMESQILNKLKRWANKEYLSDYARTSLYTLSYLYQDLDKDAFMSFTDSLAFHDIKRKLQYEAAVQIIFLDNATDVTELKGYLPASVVINNLHGLISDMKRHEKMRDEAIALDFFVSRYKWKYRKELGITDIQVLLPEFTRHCKVIEENENIQRFSESYDILNILCSITTDYAHVDKEMTIEVNKLRKIVRQKCEENVNGKSFILGYHFFEHFHCETLNNIGMNAFGLDISASEIDKLEEDISGCYPDNDFESLHDGLMCDWDKIRQMQREGYYSDNKLSEEVEKLSIKSASVLSKNDSLASIAYDIALFSKGYLLRSEQQVAKVIEQSGNRTVLEQYRQYLLAKQQLDNSSISTYEADSLRNQVKSIWSDLRYKSKRFDDYTKGMECSWRDVQDQLDDDEIAVEYITNGQIYYSLIIKKGFDAPLIGYVGAIDSDLKELGDSVYLKVEPIYSLWPKSVLKRAANSEKSELLHPLDGVKRIYFSPTGALHQISMENMLTDSGKRMCEQYEMYRLSNTREIITHKQQKRNGVSHNATLFGGVVYDFDDNDWKEVAQRKDKLGAESIALRDVPALTREAISSLEYLPGTLTEILNINRIIENNNTMSQTYTGKASTEEQFKEMSGTDMSILHIATHGYYQNNDVRASSIIVNADQKDDKEGGSLSRSGLFLSGASSMVYGESIPQNVEDGILTAREISTLDFTNVELVTLSACETGLGDITSEGVFGLQRGFKKAGVNSILMSLWKVDDEATCKLMTEFYSNWIGKKMTKHDALEAAKRTVRETKGWEDPKYWAAFILLDGLD